MPAVKIVAIIAALLIGLLLSVPHAALAQSLFEANDLNQQVIQLYKQGRYSEAIPLAQRTLTILESTWSGSSRSCRGATISRNYIEPKIVMPMLTLCTNVL
jgi:hypothetical protein